MSGTLITTLIYPASDATDASTQYDTLVGVDGTLEGDTVLSQSFYRDVRNSGTGQLIIVVSQTINVSDANQTINTRLSEIGSATISSASVSSFF